MNNKKTSKFLSLILRHKPETIGIELDENGWVDIPVLLEALTSSGHGISLEELEAVVNDNDKQRFIISDGRIRANQGHSIDIALGLEAKTPPQALFHGTATRFLEQIKQNGLLKMSRQHVHLSTNEETARSVGVRHGKPVILVVNSELMYSDGHEFILSDNGVWLVDSVPFKYIDVISPTT
jgi:putative RNA 2'-phosphotransferase